MNTEEGIISEQTRAFAWTHRHDDVRRLALTTRQEGLDLTAALTQIEGRRKAMEKIPSWADREDIVFPPQLSMEQCSSELTALYKLHLVRSLSSAAGEELEDFTDLTGGLGIDCAFIAKAFGKATYVERQAHLCALARHNFKVLGLTHTEVCREDAETHLNAMPNCQWIYLDPARRSNAGGKVAAIRDCEPNLLEMRERLMEKAARVLVKLSPMLDIRKAVEELQHVSEVHVVAVDNECKELLFILEKTAGDKPLSVTCADLSLRRQEPRLFTFCEQDEKMPCRLASDLRSYLYEPNASLLKAGAYKSVANRWNLEKLHPNSHLYTADTLQADFHGRIFEVEACSSFGKKDLKALLQGIDKANLTVRNFPQSVSDLRKRLKLKEGGEHYFFATTLHDGKKVLVRCKPVKIGQQ